MTILIQLLLLFLWFFGKMEIKFLVYYPIWTLVWKKKYEKVGKRFHRLIKLEQTDKLAKSTSWEEITVKFWRPGEKSWMNLVLNKPINQADKPNITDFALILGTKKDNQASVKSRDVSLKVSGFSLKNEETPGIPPNFP